MSPFYGQVQRRVLPPRRPPLKKNCGRKSSGRCLRIRDGALGGNSKSTQEVENSLFQRDLQKREVLNNALSFSFSPALFDSNLRSGWPKLESSPKTAPNSHLLHIILFLTIVVKIMYNYFPHGRRYFDYM